MHYTLMAYDSETLDTMLEPFSEHNEAVTSLSKLRHFNEKLTVETEDIQRFLQKRGLSETLLVREDRLYDQDGNLNHVLHECLQAGVENVIVFDEYGRFRKWGHSVYNGKWDWFVVGGRWSGFLLAKPGATIPDTAIRGGAHENVMREAMNKLFAQSKKIKSSDMELLELPDDQYDRLPKGCIDLERMQALQGVAARKNAIKERLDRYFANPDRFDIRSYEEIRANYIPKSSNEFPTVSRFKIHAAFIEQPGVKELAKGLNYQALDLHSALLPLEKDFAYEFMSVKFDYPWAASLRMGEWADVSWGVLEPDDAYNSLVNLKKVASHWNDAHDDELITIVDCHT